MYSTDRRNLEINPWLLGWMMTSFIYDSADDDLWFKFTVLLQTNKYLS